MDRQMRPRRPPVQPEKGKRGKSSRRSLGPPRWGSLGEGWAQHGTRKGDCSHVSLRGEQPMVGHHECVSPGGRAYFPSGWQTCQLIPKGMPAASTFRKGVHQRPHTPLRRGSSPLPP